MAQDCFILAQVGPKTPKMASKGFPSTPRWGQNDSKMGSKLICFSFMVVFSRFASGPTFSTEFLLFGSFESTNFWYLLFGTKFHGFWIIFGILGRVCPKRSQDTLIIAAGWPTWAYLDPTWIQVGSKLAQVGPMLDPSWFQLGSSWAHVGPRSESPAAPEPTQALPNPLPVASGPPKPPFVPYKTQHKPQKGSQTSNLDLHNPQLGPQKTPTWLQKTPSQVPNPTAQARRNGE